MIYLLKKDISFGILLILLGVLFLLLNFNLISLSVAAFILSIAILIRYFMNNNIVSLILGLSLFGISSVFILDEYVFKSLEMKGVLFLWIFAIIAFIIFMKEKNKLFLLSSLTLLALGFYLLIVNIYGGNPIWVLLVFISIVFYIYYLFIYRRAGIEWPKKLSLILLGLSIVVFIFIKLNATNIKILKLINYIWPVLLILLGIRLIYNKNKY